MSGLVSLFRAAPRTPSRTNRPIVVVLALLAMGGAIFFMVNYFNPRPHAINPVPMTLLGQVTAQETVRRLNGHGQIVIVTTAADGNLSVAIPQTAFCKAIADAAGVQILATVTTDASPDHLGGIPAQKFFEIRQAYPAANAIVSFVGAPQLTDSEIREIRSGGPLWVILNEPFPRELHRLLSRDVIQLAVVSGAGPTAAPNPTTPREQFEQYYQLINRDNLSLLPP